MSVSTRSIWGNGGLLLLLATAFLPACDDGDGGDNCNTPTGTSTGTSTGTATGTATGTSTGTATGTPTGTTSAGPTLVEWLVDQGQFGYVHGSYGKSSFCGALEFDIFGDEDANGDGILDPGEDLDGDGVLDPNYTEMRCTDANTYFFSDNGDGTYRFEEAMYVYRITEPVNPYDSFPFFIESGYSGSLIYKLTPVTPALAGVSEYEAVEFEAEVIDGVGNDPYWVYSVGIKNKMVFARGKADDMLIDFKTADWTETGTPPTGSWTVEYPAMWMGWAIHLYPMGGGQPPNGASAAFLTKACAAGDLVPGTTVGVGGVPLMAGPGYCAPDCRMPTDNDPEGANGLPPCTGDFLTERPRAASLH